MKYLNIQRWISEFKPLMQSSALQVAVMSLKAGKSSSDRLENEHPGTEQWLLVMSGSGVARVGRRRVRLSAGVLLFIPKKAPHKITNTGRMRLTTVNFYSPPAYTPSGKVKPAVARLR